MAVAAAMAVLCLPPAAAAADIRIGGTGNAVGTMRLLGEAFASRHPASRPVVLDSIGTSGAIRAVPKGAIDIGLSSRPLTEEETRSGLTTHEYARSPTVFAVQERNPVASITVEQLAAIYGGRMTHWPDGTRIRPVLRQPGDDNTRQIRMLSAEFEKALGLAERRPGLTFASNDQEAADRMEGTPGSIGVTTLALIRAEKRRLRPLALDGVEPTPENAATGRYPMIKRFYFVLPREPAPAVREFLGFVASPQGRRLLEQTGHIVP
jgi:phosphate transport system substrate-binding protein